AAPLSRRLRLLPLGGRPGRRGRRRPARPEPAALVARGAAALLRRPAPPPGHDRPARHHPPVRHSAPAVPGPACRLRAGPADHPLPDLRTAPRVLPLLGQPGRTPGPVPVPGVRRGTGPAGGLCVYRTATG